MEKEVKKTEFDKRVSLNGETNLLTVESLVSTWRYIGKVEGVPLFTVDTHREYDRGVNYDKTLAFIREVLQLEKLSKGAGRELIRIQHPLVARLIDNAGTAQALNLIYHPPAEENKELYKIWNIVINGLKSARGIRWRLDVLRQQMTEYAHAFTRDKPVQILSIASGHGEAPIEVLSDLLVKDPHTNIAAKLIDYDGNAIAHSRKLAKLRGVEKFVKFLEIRLQDYEFTEGEANIIEIAGVIDYLNLTRTKKLLIEARKATVEDGVVFIGNMLPLGEEENYVTTGWRRMYYRSPQELAKLIIATDFDPNKSSIISDSNQTVAVIIARP